MAAVAEDKCRIHVAGDKADLYFHTDELHGRVVTDGINGHRGIPADLAFHPVEEAFIKPFHGSDRARPALGGLIAVKRRRLYAGVEGQVIFPDKVPEDAVELLQGMDRIHVPACLWMPRPLGGYGSGPSRWIRRSGRAARWNRGRHCRP